MSQVPLLFACFLYLSLPVCKMGVRRLITYVRATGMQYFTKALKNLLDGEAQWEHRQPHHSDSKLLRVKT